MKQCSLNSFLSMGCSDGPGIRSVIFLQGCHLRCIYCHNPETWQLKDNNTCINDLIQKIRKFKPYYKNNGGVTVSGGEPLLQSAFVSTLFAKLKQENINTCLDTSGHGDLELVHKVLENTDLVLCDLKFANNDDYKKYALGSLTQVLNFLYICDKLNKKVIIRHLLVPNITDNKEYILKLKNIISKYNCISNFELLPFKNICQSKYDNLKIKFPLSDVLPTEKKLLEDLKKI